VDDGKDRNPKKNWPCNPAKVTNGALVQRDLILLEPLRAGGQDSRLADQLAAEAATQVEGEVREVGPSQKAKNIA